MLPKEKSITLAIAAIPHGRPSEEKNKLKQFWGVVAPPVDIEIKFQLSMGKYNISKAFFIMVPRPPQTADSNLTRVDSICSIR